MHPSKFSNITHVKVLQLIARMNKGGTSTWVRILTEGLRREGVEVIVASGHTQNGEIEDRAFDEVGGVRIDNLGRKLGFLADLKSLVAIRKLILLEKPDLINTHTAKAGFLGRIARISLPGHKIAMVHTFHGHLLYGYFDPFATRIIVIIERFLARCTDRLIVPGNKIKHDLLELRIGTSEKYSVIYPGVERLRIFSKQKYKGKFGLQENQITIGWMGRITSIKNPLEILEIAQKLPECKFIVAGDGEKDLLDHLKNKAGKNISFTGWSKPQDFWSACDIALLTSKNEAQPIVIVEANYAALPVVARDVGAVSEVIISGRNGFLFDTIEKAVECIRILVANEKMRKTMGDEGMQMAISRYGISRFIDEHLKAYSSIKN